MKSFLAMHIISFLLMRISLKENNFYQMPRRSIKIKKWKIEIKRMKRFLMISRLIKRPVPLLLSATLPLPPQELSTQTSFSHKYLATQGLNSTNNLLR